MSSIKFNYISTYNETGPVRSQGEITIERYGRTGWAWDNARTNEEGNGLWENGQQVQGVLQFALPKNTRPALYKLAKIQAEFNSQALGGKFEDLHCEFILDDAPNSKPRSEFIFNTAVSVLEAAGGHARIDSLTGEDRRQRIEVMYASVIEQTGCVRETAKRNVAKALRRARYGEVIRRGGARFPAGGRPRKAA
jgi:hypothetical protein